MYTSSAVRAISYPDVALSVSRINNALRIKFLPKELPRDGSKNEERYGYITFPLPVSPSTLRGR